MENKKSAPKTKDKTAKSRTNTVRANNNKLKTAKKLKPSTVSMNTVDTLKRQYAKGKAEIQLQTEEQTQSPENYAVDTVEDKAESAAYATADVAKQSGRYIKNRVRWRESDRSIPTDNIDTPPVNVEPQPLAFNELQTKALPDVKQEQQECVRIKTRHDAVKSKEHNSKHKTDIKTKDNVLSHSADEPPKIKTKDSVLSEYQHTNSEQTKTQTAQEQMRTKAKKQSAVKSETDAAEPKMRIKTKEEYLQNKAAENGRTYHIKSGEYKSKPKALQAMQEKQTRQQLNPQTDRTQAARKYVQNKLKAKEEILKGAEMRNNDIIPISDISAVDIPRSDEPHIQQKTALKQRPPEQIKVKMTDVKTCDSYIRTHSRTADIKTKQVNISVNPKILSGEKQLIKSKTSVMKSTAPKSKPAAKMCSVRKTAKTAKTAQKSAKKAVKTQKQAVKVVVE